MGAGIAQVAATHGCIVHLLDVNEQVLRRGVESIQKNLDRAVEKGKLRGRDRDAIIARISPRVEALEFADTPSPRPLPRERERGVEDEAAEPDPLIEWGRAVASHTLQEVDIAIEAVVENLDVKRRVFQGLERATPPTAVLATNTSSLSVSKIAEAVRDPSRVVGMHFFNPAPLMPLVEVIAGRQSSAAGLDRAFAAAKEWGKVAVRAKDTPGFIVNRVARGFYLEALRLLGEGVAGVDEIDLVMRTHAGFRMGPFELMDLIGVDVNLAVSTSVWEQMDKHPRFAPHPIQRQLAAAGHLGRKTGRGFYLYAEDRRIPACAVDRRSFTVDPKLADVMTAFCQRSGALGAMSTERLVLARILAAIINEAGFARDEDVATAEDIDVAMVKGTNYPKGPLAWAEAIGPRTVRGALRALNASVGDGRYEAAKLFAEAK